jgi:hypothetical protein
VTTPAVNALMLVTNESLKSLFREYELSIVKAQQAQESYVKSFGRFRVTNTDTVWKEMALDQSSPKSFVTPWYYCVIDFMSGLNTVHILSQTDTVPTDDMALDQSSPTTSFVTPW